MSFSQYVNGNTLNLSNQQSLDIHQLMMFLQSNTNIEHLYLISCGIDSEGAKALAKSQYLKNLTMLGLSRNNIGDEGVKN